jgi:hypothetical protein
MEFIGNEFENAPTLFNIPVLFVVQTMGGVRLVVNSQVYSPFGVPPVPDTIKLPPETCNGPKTGACAGAAFCAPITAICA